jgi:protein-disulfide isomerase
MATNDQKNQARAKREQAQAAAEAAAKRNRNLQFLAGTLFAALVVVILVVIISGGKDTPKQGAAAGDKVEGVEATKTLLKGVPQNGLVLGDPKAPITMLEFVDVQCPFCRDHQLDQQPALIQKLVRTGRVQLKVQPLALPQMGEDSVAGQAVALRLSHDNKAWDFINLFYWNQGDEGTGYVTPEYLTKLLKAIPGAPVNVKREIDARDSKLAAEIEKASEVIGAKYSELGESFGTPAFAIGKTGAKIETFEPVIPRSEDRIQPLTEAVTKLEQKLGVK